jgi:hypothetical protein
LFRFMRRQGDHDLFGKNNQTVYQKSENEPAHRARTGVAFPVRAKVGKELIG